MIDIKFLESQNKGLKAQNIELQQEINELKAENKQLNDIIDSYQPRLEELKELKAENETLKITREKLLGDLCITEESLKDYEEHYKRSEQQKEKYYQQTLDNEIQINELFQILQEIKTIAKQCMNKDTCYDCEYCDDCYIEDVEIPTYDICKLLVQKITKAEGE